MSWRKKDRKARVEVVIFRGGQKRHLTKWEGEQHLAPKRTPMLYKQWSVNHSGSSQHSSFEDQQRHSRNEGINQMQGREDASFQQEGNEKPRKPVPEHSFLFSNKWLTKSNHSKSKQNNLKQKKKRLVEGQLNRLPARSLFERWYNGVSQANWINRNPTWELRFSFLMPWGTLKD